MCIQFSFLPLRKHSFKYPKSMSVLRMCDSREFCRSSRDSTIGINFDALGDVEHFEHLSGDFYDLYKSGEHADVTFVVSGVRFPAHRIILAGRCAYFKVLLFGEMKEARLGPGAEIPFSDTTPEAFGALLEYIYSGKLCLGDLTDEVSLCVCMYVVYVLHHMTVCIHKCTPDELWCPSMHNMAYDATAAS